MRIALAQTRFPQAATEGTRIVLEAITKAAKQQCDIICFPESIIPGLRGVGYSVEAYDHDRMTDILDEVRLHARNSGIAVIL
ncbi:nitrilase-related carbon-nitrogen hydrolase, partial [Ferroacidibacillus organovorans]